MATTRTITNAYINQTLPDIFYEDPEPKEIDMLQRAALRQIADLLTDYYQDDPDVFAMDAGFIAYNPENGNDRIAPDCYIAFDVDAEGIIKNIPNFWIWEVGKAPDFVMEVGSKSTASRDLGEKRDLYQRLGIAEYWRFDPTGGEYYGQPIIGERLVEGEYRPYDLQVDSDGSVRGYSELLDLEFYWDGEAFDVLDPQTGKTIDKFRLEREARLAAEAREQELRLASESRERELLAEIERLRRQSD